MKKLASIGFLLGLFIVPSTVSAAVFPDVPEDFWAYSEINELLDREVMSGFPDGTFQPNEPVKRFRPLPCWSRN